MPKMTKAKAVKRLDEASKKVLLVFVDYSNNMSTTDIRKLQDIHRDIRRLAMKLK
mgnify:CR=1 FL=1|tara:strand:- start:690 stop:854 length:165 start_codon:yes stop_codon:yes gene_type:complete